MGWDLWRHRWCLWVICFLSWVCELSGVQQSPCKKREKEGWQCKEKRWRDEEEELCVKVGGKGCSDNCVLIFLPLNDLQWGGGEAQPSFDWLIIFRNGMSCTWLLEIFPVSSLIEGSWGGNDKDFGVWQTQLRLWDPSLCGLTALSGSSVPTHPHLHSQENSKGNAHTRSLSHGEDSGRPCKKAIIQKKML